MSSVYGDFRSMPSPYLNMRGYGQLGSGTYGTPDVPDVPMFSQPAVPQDWTSNALQAAKGAGFGSGAAAMNDLPQINDMSKPGLFDNFGGKDGWGNTAISGIGALASTFLGMKQYGLAKKTMEENKRQFQLNYDAQRQMTNTRLEDRQRARVASNAGAYQSVGDYMATNGVR